ncbi:protein-disulfide reductase DsbD domain-containing protein [Shewanella algae]|uniref:cytochrome c biogenesis protein CcdA n=2 Tax=Shewanella algae TaxID=38313 RepID=UPI001AADDED3|nr:thioredoxin family protein [Shewanella algae]
MYLKRIWHAFAVCLMLLSQVALAEPRSSGWLKHPDHPPVKVQLTLADVDAGQVGELNALLDVALSGDWKTYWRAPGEGGIPPTLDWSASENIATVDWHWPLPQRYVLQGIETLGYKGDTLFPLTIRLKDPGQPFRLKGTLTLSSCTNVCVLTDYPVELSGQAAGLKADDGFLHQWGEAMARVPQGDGGAVLQSIVWDEKQQLLQLAIEAASPWQQADLFLFGEDETVSELIFSRPQIQIDGKRLTATFGVKHWLGTPELEGKPLLIHLADTHLSAELSGAIATGHVAKPQPSLPLWSLFLMALAGGLILNIMPCVLPVLGMKVHGVMMSSQGSRSQVRGHFMASALGILLSFWLIAAGLSLLKLSGQSLGWGIQFQQPWFIGFMVLLTWGFGLNLLGVFEINLPSKWQTRLAGAGDDSRLGHMLQGMLATLLATPCTAPFLGTAVAFALGADYPMLFALFSAMGLGMALPWLMLALWPALAQRLPKPGRWMNWVKPVFALMMLATCLWLLSLLQSFFSVAVILGLGALMLLLTLGLLGKRYGTQVMVYAIGGSFLVASLALGVGYLTRDAWVSPLPSDHHWQPLNLVQLKQAVDEGKTVFVDVTADWCITCQANKVGVLLQNPVYDALGDDRVLLMRGDWTKPSEEITAYLKANGRFGVPFNQVYGPGTPAGKPLPVILSSDGVLAALAEAESRQ